MTSIRLPSMLLLPAAVLSGMALTGCSSSGDVMQLSRDTYMVTSQSRLGNADGAAAGVLKADAYCQQSGRRVQMSSAETSDGVFAIRPSKSVVMFKCVNAEAR